MKHFITSRTKYAFWRRVGVDVHPRDERAIDDFPTRPLENTTARLVLWMLMTVCSRPLLPMVARVADPVLFCCCLISAWTSWRFEHDAWRVSCNGHLACSQSAKRDVKTIATDSSGHAPRGCRRFIEELQNKTGHVNRVSFISAALLTLHSPLQWGLDPSPVPFNAIAVVIAHGSTLLTGCEGGSTASSSYQTVPASAFQFWRNSFNGVLVTEPTLVDTPRQRPVFL